MADFCSASRGKGGVNGEKEEEEEGKDAGAARLQRNFSVERS